MKKIKRILMWYFIPLLGVVAVLAVYGHFNPEKVFNRVRDVERAAAKLTEKTVTVNGLDYCYLEGGDGEPLILVHGFGADKDHWTRVARYLTRHYRVIAPDLPGFGDSTQRIDLDYSYAAQARRLHDFVSALDLPAVHMGGSSMGGGVAGAYATLFPEAVKSLWLVAPGNVVSPEDSDFFTVLKSGADNPLIPDSPETLATTLDYLFHKKPFMPPAIVGMLSEQAAAEKGIREIIFHALIQEKEILNTQLGESEIPTLVLWGEQDRVIDKSAAGVLCGALKKAVCVILSPAGHLPMIEQPSASAKAFLSFQKHPPQETAAEDAHEDSLDDHGEDTAVKTDAHGPSDHAAPKDPVSATDTHDAYVH